MFEAMYYQKTDNNKVSCNLCPQGCNISEGESGMCLARKNIEGKLYSLTYGEITSEALDPIEKKPLYHFYPGKMIYSLGSFGCNLTCKFCQNHTISREKAPSQAFGPEEIVSKALKLKSMGNIGVAFTYNEPLINYEFVRDTFKLAKEKGLKTILVTNGFVNIQPLTEIVEYIDAMNIDLKAFDRGLFKTFCSGELENVKETIRFVAARCHIELTTLVVPGLNDNVEDIESIAKWIAQINPEIPYHISRFFPRYNMEDETPTKMEIMREAVAASKKHLKYVYAGNV